MLLRLLGLDKSTAPATVPRLQPGHCQIPRGLQATPAAAAAHLLMHARIRPFPQEREEQHQQLVANCSSRNTRACISQGQCQLLPLWRTHCNYSFSIRKLLICGLNVTSHCSQSSSTAGLGMGSGRSCERRTSANSLCVGQRHCPNMSPVMRPPSTPKHTQKQVPPSNEHLSCRLALTVVVADVEQCSFGAPSYVSTS